MSVYAINRSRHKHARTRLTRNTHAHGKHFLVSRLACSHSLSCCRCVLLHWPCSSYPTSLLPPPLLLPPRSPSNESSCIDLSSTSLTMSNMRVNFGRIFGALEKLLRKENNDFEELDLRVVRYKPACLDILTKRTHFSRKELQLIYRGFKQECPTGIVNEMTFKEIYAQFFPNGDASMYAHFVFNTFDNDRSGSLTFEQFVQGLSVLARGSHQEKLLWVFNLYDVNGDGVITKQEMTDIVSAIYDLMGRHTEPAVDEVSPKEHVEKVFQRMDLNQDGVISIDEFMESCRTDSSINHALSYFDTFM